MPSTASFFENCTNCTISGIKINVLNGGVSSHRTTTTTTIIASHRPPPTARNQFSRNSCPPRGPNRGGGPGADDHETPDNGSNGVHEDSGARGRDSSPHSPRQTASVPSCAGRESRDSTQSRAAGANSYDPSNLSASLETTSTTYETQDITPGPVFAVHGGKNNSKPDETPPSSASGIQGNTSSNVFQPFTAFGVSDSCRVAGFDNYQHYRTHKVWGGKPGDVGAVGINSFANLYGNVQGHDL
ncbi:hypothetical protein DFH07DRAFT_536868 [Mycena maculata]|uniref:Uncharacterized protein n=1 Tax=Mycena maculata TaxID=230809 RepID=A0AAD7K7H3_9AGAR|nr:hypothetical protein DFH07DRAFT_536868 [Mycena maculata]